MDQLRQLLPHLGPAFIVLARLTGLFIYAPVLSSPAIPPRVKALLAFTLTLAIYTAMIPSLQTAGAYDLQMNLLTIAPVMAAELLIGFTIGFLASLPLIACQLGGQTVGQQLGVGMARAFNPAFDDESEVVGQLLFYLALTTFIFFGGVEILFSSIITSFDTVPIGGFRPDLTIIETITAIITSAYELALRIAAPVLAIIFLETLALGFISKTAPAFNIMSLGFPLRVMVGLSTLIASIYAINEIIADEWIDVLETIHLLPLTYGG